MAKDWKREYQRLPLEEPESENLPDIGEIQNIAETLDDEYISEPETIGEAIRRLAETRVLASAVSQLQRWTKIAQRKAEDRLSNMMDDEDVTRFSTVEGTVYVEEKLHPVVTNMALVKAREVFRAGNGEDAALMISTQKLRKYVQEMIEEGKEVPEGLNVFVRRSIRFRRA